MRVLAGVLAGLLSLAAMTGCDEAGYGYDAGGGGWVPLNEGLEQWPSSTWDTWDSGSGDYYNDTTGEWGNY